MGKAKFWAPGMSGVSADPQQDTIAIRRRIRHQARSVGAAGPRQPITIPVKHLKWHDEAACIGTDPEAFFPDGTPERYVLQICNGSEEIPACPVKQLCLEQALENPFEKGIWGGTSETERRRIRQVAARKAARRDT